MQGALVCSHSGSQPCCFQHMCMHNAHQADLARNDASTLRGAGNNHQGKTFCTLKRRTLARLSDASSSGGGGLPLCTPAPTSFSLACQEVHRQVRV